jgi:hypothetical protein
VAISNSRDLLSYYLLQMVLVAHILVDSDSTVALINALFDKVVDVAPANFAIPALLLSMSSACDGLTKDELDAGFIANQQRLILEYQKRHSSTCEGKTGVKFYYSALSSYPQYPYRKYGHVNKTVLQVFIDNAKVEGGYDYNKIRYYIANVAKSGHPEYRDMGGSTGMSGTCPGDCPQ